MAYSKAHMAELFADRSCGEFFLEWERATGTRQLTRHLLRAYGYKPDVKNVKKRKSDDRDTPVLGGVFKKWELGFLKGDSIEIDISSAYASAAATISGEDLMLDGATQVRDLCAKWIHLRKTASASGATDAARIHKKNANTFIGCLAHELPRVRVAIVKSVNDAMQALIDAVTKTFDLRVVSMHSDSATFTVSKSREAEKDADALKITPLELSGILACASDTVAPRFNVRVAGHFCCMLLCPKYEVGLLFNSTNAKTGLPLFARGLPQKQDRKAVELMHTYCLLELSRRAESETMITHDASFERLKCFRTHGLQEACILEKTASTLRKKCEGAPYLTLIDSMCELMCRDRKPQAASAFVQKRCNVCFLCGQEVALHDASHTLCIKSICDTALLANLSL